MPSSLEDLKAALAGRYEIDKEIGQGAMATVYLAQDLKHDRKVAVKVLLPELAVAVGGDRFVREITTTASLQHPHILPLFDSGEAGGLLYYVMPFVEGESLADRIERDGQLALDEAVMFTREVADALHYAHQRGIVHRDIKPANIMITGGHALVADFGIASAVTAAGGEKLTQTGIAVGTPAYMAPEQAAAEQPDGRADIYSLGCTLYEMLLGSVPFTANSPRQILARHAMEDVPRPSIQRKTIPEELEDAILCAMNKSPADRFTTAGEFSEALGLVDTATSIHKRQTTPRRIHRRLRTTRSKRYAMGLLAVGVVVAAITAWQLWPGSRSTVGTLEVARLDPTKVAVLYFEDLTPGGAYQFVADGLTEDLIERLSQASALDVVSRNGVAPYRGGAVSMDSIARALSVGSLIVGSVESVGDRPVVTTRLLDGGSGAEVSRGSVEMTVDDIVAVETSVALRVTFMLREWLGEEVRLGERRTGTRNAEAVSLLLLGERLRKGGEALIGADSVYEGFNSFDRADSVLAVAEAADPRWIAPLVLRAQIAYRRTRLSEDMVELFDWVDVGMAHAERALAIDPNYPEALEARGNFRYWAWLNDREPDSTAARKLLHEAKADLERAVELDLGLASAFAMLSHLYYNTGVEGITSVLLAAGAAFSNDPYLSVADRVLWRLFTGRYDLEQFPQAQRWCNVGRDRFPDDFRFVECQLLIMATPLVQPDAVEAWRLWEELTRLVPEPARELQSHKAQIWVGGILAQAGMADSARAVLERARVAAEVDPTFELAYLEAYMRVLLGDYDEAISRLKLLLSANPSDPDDIPTGGPYWWWRDLRSHPEFDRVRAVTG